MSLRIVQSFSPLQYNHGARVHRLAIVVPEAGPPAPSDTYFAPTEVRSTRRGKQKLPGADEGVIAFIDWHDQGDAVVIDFMKTRRDQSNRGYATHLMREFYKLHRNRSEIDWGKIQSDFAEKLFHRMQKEEKKPPARAKLF
jgi:hypothetical protein